MLAKDAVVHSLASKVYPAARITSSRVQVNPEAHTADVQLEVDSGPPMVFGALVVNGLKRYKKSIVENLNPIRPGDPYDEDELIKFQRRLLATGISPPPSSPHGPIACRRNGCRSQSPWWRRPRNASSSAPA